MALVHMAFYASFVTFPEKYGARFASDKNMEAFVHFWRVIGYYMGMDDRFNLAKDWPIAKLRSFLIELGMHLVVPSIICIDHISLTMARAVCQAGNASYPVVVYTQAIGEEARGVV